ncbi:hypothetical protein G6F32_017435 [Rhizopus arrhizus]|nr:hypothetical protein G6F32_017435 [Rhizopus arrhizus]
MPANPTRPEQISPFMELAKTLPAAQVEFHAAVKQHDAGNGMRAGTRIHGADRIPKRRRHEAVDILDRHVRPG